MKYTVNSSIIISEVKERKPHGGNKKGSEGMSMTAMELKRFEELIRENEQLKLEIEELKAEVERLKAGK